MKYLEKPKGKKDGKAPSYLIIICSLVAVGAVAWLALALGGTGDGVPKTKAPESEPQQSYKEPDTSYNDNTPLPETPPATETEEPIDTEPYAPPVDTAEPVTEPEQALIMPLTGEILKAFSDTALQFSATYNDMRLHAATDIEAAAGTAVLSCGDGTVKSVEQGTNSGNCVTIEHKGGVTFKYCGLDKITVANGDTVKMGDSIGTVGTVPMECSDKSHLHLEAYSDNKPVNPMDIIGKLD